MPVPACLSVYMCICHLGLKPFQKSQARQHPSISHSVEAGFDEICDRYFIHEVDRYGRCVEKMSGSNVFIKVNAFSDSERFLGWLSLDWAACKYMEFKETICQRINQFIEIND
jgi:hypothetical protein